MSEASENVKRAALDLTPAEWRQVVRDVNAEFALRHEAELAREAERVALVMDMTPEGYVREWVARGCPQERPLRAWEKAYQDAGIIERAERTGYVEIGRGVSCPVTLTASGRALIPSHEGEPGAATDGDVCDALAGPSSPLR